MTNGNDLAFGQVTYQTLNGGGRESGTLTKREYFAAMAMQGIVQQYEVDYKTEDSPYGQYAEIARQSVEMANALIAELNKQP